MNEQLTLMEKLEELFPEFINSLNIDNYYEEGYGYLYNSIFAQLCRYFILHIRYPTEVKKINDFLVSLIGTSPENEDLIITGFLETLDPTALNYQEVKSLLDNRIRIALEHLDDVLALKKTAPENWFE